MNKILVFAVLWLIIWPCSASDFILVSDGKPVAVIAPVDNDSVMKIAGLFNKYIKEITGTELQMKSLKGGYQISFRLLTPEEIVGDPHFAGIKAQEVIKDAFRISEKWGLMFISATTIKGLENAVHSFMERYAGVRRYAHDAVVVPKMKTFSVPEIDWFDVPAFSFRTPYYYEATYQDYIDFHKLTASPKDTDKPSWPVSNDWGLWVHTMHRLLPPDKFFTEHPDYYALRNGIRMTDQACLSNPDVLEIVCTNLGNEIKSNPSARYWSVSQMDNYNYCECEKCREIDSIEGSQSGTVIRFANNVAERFPDKVISTLAYQYTRKAPLVTKPLPNVNIMLCTIECNRNVPIAADSADGSFYHDIKAWSALTHNILVWDYVINFSHLLAPFPNFHVLAPNLQMFDNFGADMMFEQGLRGCRSGEFNELRCYLLSKLMWNPYEDADSVMNDFITGYYGKDAGIYIKEYILKMSENLALSGKALTLYEPPFTHSNGYMSPENLNSYLVLFDKALASCKGDSIRTHRVEMAMQSVKYAWLEVTKALPFTDDWLFEKEGSHKLKESNALLLDDLVDRAVQYGPELFHETSLPPDEYHRIMKDYFLNAIVNHKATGAEVSYSTLPHQPYVANGLKSLTDGVKGTTAYQMLWQGWWGEDLEITIKLDTICQINEVRVGYLDNNQSWIIAPRSAEAWISNDGSNYKHAGYCVNEGAGEKLPVHASTLEIKLPEQAKARFLKIKVLNQGKLPAWRGINADSWLFIDEIEIY
jgi:hypothetical protein